MKHQDLHETLPHIERHAGAESYGRLPEVADEYFEALASGGDDVLGSGMAMEGIEQNPVVYEFASELAFW